MVEMATTRDLRTWNRLREPFLTPARLDHGVARNYERMLVQPVNRPIERDGELWLYYTGAFGFVRRARCLRRCERVDARLRAN